MTKTRYGFSFIISALVYTSLGISLFSLANVPTILKKPEEESIKISIITPPLVKKVIEPVKIPTPPVIIPPKKVEPKKVVKKKIVKKVKPKKVIKKPKPKKIVKKKIVKKVEPKKIVKKKVEHKKVIKKVKPIEKKIEPQPIIEPEPIYYSSSIVPDEVYTQSSIVEDTPPMVYNEPEIYYEPEIYNEPQQIEPTIVSEPIYSAPEPVIEAPQPIVRQEPQPVAIPVQEPQPMFQTVAPQQPQTNNNEAKKSFLNNLRAKIISNKEYPKMALRRHIQGSVSVRFDLTSSGTVDNIRFLDGKTILQKGVRKAILRSFPITIPPEVQNDLPMYNISVTVNFNIN
jgi:protein TonB